MERHITAVAALRVGWSIMGLMFVALIFILLSGLGMVVHDEEAMVIIWMVLPGLGILLGILCLLGIIGGIGLFAHQNWARILVLILSAIDLLNIPIGTALGIYSVWVLVQAESVELFVKRSK